METGRFRLVALDLDGTLLDPAGELRPAVREAVRATAARGVRVVVCTGRRWRTARRFLEELDLPGVAVLQNGVVVKDVSDGRTLDERYLPASLYAGVLAVLREAGPPLVYVDEPAGTLDIVTEPPERAHAYQREYLDDNVAVTRFVPSLDRAPTHALVMLSCMAEREALLALRRRVDSTLGRRVRTHLLANLGYRGHILEVVSAESGKWPALRGLAAAAGIAPEEILALGDDENDAEMLRESGCGVAMANASPAALAAADRTVASNAEGGVVEALEELVLS